MTAPIDTVVIGAGGYVGGELLRLLADHPHFRLAAAVSENRTGEPIASLLPSLAHHYPDSGFTAIADAVSAIPAGGNVAIFAAAPHGASGASVAQALQAAKEKSLTAKVVDLSADFRHRSADRFEALYGVPHPAPALLPRFRCALPEHRDTTADACVSHPGCFATAAIIAAVPLFAEDLAEPEVFISGVTGSSGSGRKPGAGTHHPDRHGNLWAYKPLCHRHAPEIEAQIFDHAGTRANVHFVPHSGPFSRGIHLTLAARLKQRISAEDVLSRYRSFYAASRFVQPTAVPPRLKDVVGSNQARIGVAVDRGQLAVFCVIDNLLKGAAGGAFQWMNRLWSLPEDAGLTASPPSWM